MLKHDNSPVTVKITLTNEVAASSPVSLQVFNVIFRRFAGDCVITHTCTSVFPILCWEEWFCIEKTPSKTVEPPNNGHVGDERFVHCSEIVSFRGRNVYRKRIQQGGCPLSPISLSANPANYKAIAWLFHTL